MAAIGGKQTVRFWSQARDRRCPPRRWARQVLLYLLREPASFNPQLQGRLRSAFDPLRQAQPPLRAKCSPPPRCPPGPRGRRRVICGVVPYGHL